MSGAPAVRVTFEVAVEMTEAQRDDYEAATGTGFVALEVKNRVRPDAIEALQAVGWLREHATIIISEPKVQEAASTRLDETLRAVANGGPATARKVGQSLGVTDRRATLLLQELERQGKVRRTAAGQRRMLWEAMA